MSQAFCRGGREELGRESLSPSQACGAGVPGGCAALAFWGGSHREPPSVPILEISDHQNFSPLCSPSWLLPSLWLSLT